MRLAASAVLADTSDVRLMLQSLGRSLQSTLPERVELARRVGGLFRRPSEELSSVTVHLGQDDYVAELAGHGVRCTVGRTSGGVRIRTEELAVQDWLDRLLDALEALAEGNQNARMALQNMITGGGL
jgi:hypothetical protein